jgi:hypothetical protein
MPAMSVEHGSARRGLWTRMPPRIRAFVTPTPPRLPRFQGSVFFSLPLISQPQDGGKGTAIACAGSGVAAAAALPRGRSGARLDMKASTVAGVGGNPRTTRSSAAALSRCCINTGI